MPEELTDEEQLKALCQVLGAFFIRDTENVLTLVFERETTFRDIYGLRTGKRFQVHTKASAFAQLKIWLEGEPMPMLSTQRE